MRFTGLVKGHRSSISIGEHLPPSTEVTVERFSESGTGETFFTAENSIFPDLLECAIQEWFCEPGEAPFPEGTLLHFSYRSEGEKRNDDGTSEITEGSDGVGC